MPNSFLAQRSHFSHRSSAPLIRGSCFSAGHAKAEHTARGGGRRVERGDVVHRARAEAAPGEREAHGWRA